MKAFVNKSLSAGLDTDLKTFYDKARFGFGDYMNIELKIVCQNCGYKNRKSGSQVEDRIYINCRNCGYKIVVDATKLRAHLLNLERAVKEEHLFELSVLIR